jgi:hypothetical protein
MEAVILVVIIILICLFIYIVFVHTKPEISFNTVEGYSNDKKKKKKKAIVQKITNKDYKLYSEIIHLYKEILDRNPIPFELFDYFEKIGRGEVDLDGLKSSLLNEITELRRVTLGGKTPIALSPDNNSEGDDDDDEGDDAVKTRVSKKKANNNNNDANSNKANNGNRNNNNNNDANSNKANNANNNDANEPVMTTQKITRDKNRNRVDWDDKTLVNKYLTEMKKDKNSTLIIERPNIYNIYTDGKSAGSMNIDELTDMTSMKDLVNHGVLDKDCSADPDSKLAMKYDERRTNEIEYACVKANEAHTKEEEYKDMVLFPSFNWGDPYGHGQNKVCPVVNKCQVQPLNDHTALIGTLLEAQG